MTDIPEITQEQAQSILDTRRPLGLFYLIEDGRYVGIDNSTGNAWTEDFSTLQQCFIWLTNYDIEIGGKEYGRLQENVHPLI